ncbi:hypothetical protein HY639_01040 [Candidatus Woesearchaeota archaeon]|nr:hypothetical protein [Candidatus Woesearchaeota archaeon]
METSLETLLAPVYRSRLPQTLRQAKDYFEQAYLVDAIQKNVWTKDSAGSPLPHGGVYIDAVAKSIGTSRKNASYLINQKYHLAPLIDYYRCDTEKTPAIEHFFTYKVIDTLLTKAYDACRATATNDLQKYNGFYPTDRIEEAADGIARHYVQAAIARLPEAAKVDYVLNRVLEKNLPLQEAKTEFEREFIRVQWDGNLEQTATRLALSPRHLRRKIPFETNRLHDRLTEHVNS